MSAMVDTNVMTYALDFDSSTDATAPTNDAERRLLTMQKDSHRLLSSLEDLRISAIVWAELSRRFQKEVLDAFFAGKGRIYIVPFTALMAEEASRALAALRGSPAVCSTCKRPLESTPPCPACKLHRSVSQRVNDAFIVASAKLSGVDRLYSFYVGMIAFGKAMGFDVRKPEPAEGPLFDADRLLPTKARE